MGTGFSLWVDENLGVDGCANYMNIPKKIELYT